MTSRGNDPSGPRFPAMLVQARRWLRQRWHRAGPSGNVHDAQAAIDDHDLNRLRQALATVHPDAVVEESGVRLLHVAMEVFPAAALVLLEHGANPLLTTLDGQTPLDWALNPEFAVIPPIRTALQAAMQQRRVDDERDVLRALLEPGPSGEACAPSVSPFRRSRL